MGEQERADELTTLVSIPGRVLNQQPTIVHSPPITNLAGPD